MNQERSILFATPPRKKLLDRQYGSKGWELLAFVPQFTHRHPYGFKGTFRVTRERWTYLTLHSAWPAPALLKQYETDGWQLVVALPAPMPEMEKRHLLVLKSVVREG